MTTRAHVLVIIAVIVAGAYVLRLVRAHQLRSKYALLWLTIGVLLVPLAAVPALLQWVSDRFGVNYAPTTFLFLAAGFLFFVVVHFSWELSRLERKVRTLAEELTLLRADAVPPSGDRVDG